MNSSNVTQWGLSIVVLVCCGIARQDAAHAQIELEELRIFTMSCPPPPPKNYQHAFSEAWVERLVSRKDADAIIGHGVKLRGDRLGEAFRMEELHVERAPVFISGERPGDNISMQDLRNIFTGEVTNWEEFGMGEGKIQIYLHGGSIQRKAMQVLLRQILEVNPGQLNNVKGRLHYVGGEKSKPDDDLLPAIDQGYKNLAAAAAADANCLAMGIKDLKPRGLKTLTVDKMPIRAKEYPLQLPVYLYWARSEAGSMGRKAIEQDVNKGIAQWQADNDFRRGVRATAKPKERP